MSAESCLGLVMCALFCGIGAFCMWRNDDQRRESHLNSHPPISDDEFVKFCSPGTDPVLAIRMRHLVAEFFGVNPERIYPDTRFIDDLDQGAWT